MLTFFNILELHGINSKKVKLVRHSNVEIPVLDTFQRNFKRFEYYQSFQKPKKFANADYIASFVSDRNTLAKFLGLWDIKGFIEGHDFTQKIHDIIDSCKFPGNWHEGLMMYKLQYNPILNEFSQRLIVEWGPSTVSWVQSKDKEVVELKSKNSIGEFTSYDKVLLSFYELKQIVSNQQSNVEWVNALSNVYGIYLIREKKSGKLYVGSAYGEKGIFGRWSNYVNTGHGGNKELKELDPNYFEFSILELIPSTFSNDDVIKRENQWKIKLGTRENGLNIN
jgi:GIY-YIG catalytic domain